MFTRPGQAAQPNPQLAQPQAVARRSPTIAWFFRWRDRTAPRRLKWGAGYNSRPPAVNHISPPARGTDRARFSVLRLLPLEWRVAHSKRPTPRAVSPPGGEAGCLGEVVARGYTLPPRDSSFFWMSRC
jgi:hypothetical protein